MSRRTPLFLLVLAACSLRPHEFDASDGATAGTTTGPASTGDAASTAAPVTGEPSGTTTTTTDPATTTAGVATGDTSSGSFLLPPMDVGGPDYCDSYAQDCPEGQKCVPYSADGDSSWESLGCFDVVPRPAGVGESCTMLGAPASGQDSCDEGLMCWDVDPDTGVGTCIALCGGSIDQPTCPDPATFCSIGRVLSLCFPLCDPLAQDCDGDDLCIPNPSDPDGWLCVLDAGGDEGQVFDACEYANWCDAGLSCVESKFGAECDQQALGCCLPFCDLDLPNTCPGQGQECMPWYEPGQAPPGFEDVGLCGLPQP